MIDQAIISRIDDSISANLAPRKRTLLGNFQAASRDLAARGMTGSGNAAAQYASIACSELKVRAELIWDAIQRSHSSLATRADTATLEDLKQQFAKHFNIQVAKIREAATAQGKYLPRHDLLVPQIEVSISTVARELVHKKNVEAAFYFDHLQRQAAQSTPAAPITIQAGHIGAVLTGAHAVAHLSMSAQENTRLAEALEALRQALQTSSEATPEQRTEVEEIAGELITAVKAEKPNRPKISGLLGGLATSVQTIASLRPAWESVRDAAIAAGVLLGMIGG
jgi:hypothetical protein